MFREQHLDKQHLHSAFLFILLDLFIYSLYPRHVPISCMDELKNAYTVLL